MNTRLAGVRYRQSLRRKHQRLFIFNMKMDATYRNTVVSTWKQDHVEVKAIKSGIFFLTYVAGQSKKLSLGLSKVIVSSKFQDKIKLMTVWRNVGSRFIISH